ncbi:MAG: hypothetical protein B7Z67_01060 [Acidiphilium sp. 21-60-14]|nr:MAG: hypothetical protein B7Z67_01060 [Acidiphilium sp. 21-60-14]
MNTPRFPSQQDASMPFSFPVISEDGYIRLSFPELEAIRLIHMTSGLDEYAPEIVSAGAISTSITGYTEWISNTSPAITIGWDWQLETICNPVSLKRISEPRSNIMLEDAGKRDMGPLKTAIRGAVMQGRLAQQGDPSNRARFERGFAGGGIEDVAGQSDARESAAQGRDQGAAFGDRHVEPRSAGSGIKLMQVIGFYPRRQHRGE